MIYETRLTIPANTLETNPARAAIRIHPGVIRQIEIIFPIGCVGLAHVRLLHWQRQVWPSNPDSDFSGDDERISFSEDYEINDPPFELLVEGWNQDDTYPHTPIIRVGLSSREKGLIQQFTELFTGPRGPVSRQE